MAALSRLRRGGRCAAVAGLVAAVLAACSGERAPRTPASVASGVHRAAAEAAADERPAADPRFASADLGRGEVLSYACRPCHSLAAGEESPTGPPLHGVFGRPAGAVPGFEYSRALRESGIVWTAEALDAWLSAPADFLPGNDMAFAGFHSAEDRRDLIAYLVEETSRPAQP